MAWWNEMMNKKYYHMFETIEQIWDIQTVIIQLFNQ